MRIQQIFKSRAHGKVYLTVWVVPVLVVVGNHQENGQTNRFRGGITECCPAKIFRRTLCLRN